MSNYINKVNPLRNGVTHYKKRYLLKNNEKMKLYEKDKGKEESVVHICICTYVQFVCLEKNIN